jgi:hypothetical protein
MGDTLCLCVCIRKISYELDNPGSFPCRSRAFKFTSTSIPSVGYTQRPTFEVPAVHFVRG